MANLSTWAKWIVEATQKLADAAGHGLDTTLGQQCITLADSAVTSAQKSVVTSAEYDLTKRLREAVDHWKEYGRAIENGGNKR